MRRLEGTATPPAPTTPARARRLRLIGLVAVLAPALLVAIAAPASAHSRLVASTPAADGTVTTVPTEVTLTFSAAVSQRYTEVAVTAADGSSVAAGPPRIEGSTVHQNLAALGDGRYTVAYRTVSADGHPVGDEFGFTITGGHPGATASASANAVPPASPGPARTAAAPPARVAPAGAPPDHGSHGWLIGVVVAAVAIVGGGILFLRRRRDPRPGPGTGPAPSADPGPTHPDAAGTEAVDSAAHGPEQDPAARPGSS